MIAAVCKRAFALLLCSALVISTSGCLGTSIDAPTRQGSSHDTLRIHVLAAPATVHANACSRGLADVTTYVPLWGLAVGILTLGILVPQWTLYSCAER